MYVKLTSMTIAMVLAATLALASVGCADTPTPRVPAADVTVPLAPRPVPVAAPPPADGDSVNIATDLRVACGIGDTDRAPKFDFDSATLRSKGREQLDKLATCLTNGPLRGHAVTLVGRADPRGDDDYNLTLGKERAQAVVSYLEGQGVAEAALAPTSRGEMDASGYDEDSWALDRRVDISAATASR